MVDVNFVGEGIVFTYKVGKTIVPYKYSDVDRGIQEEIERLTRLLNIEM